ADCRTVRNTADGVRIPAGIRCRTARYRDTACGVRISVAAPATITERASLAPSNRRGGATDNDRALQPDDIAADAVRTASASSSPRPAATLIGNSPTPRATLVRYRSRQRAATLSLPQRRPAMQRTHRGFTLIELLIAVAIV